MHRAGGVGRLSLLVIAFFCFRLDAAPWREKNAFKIATSLPAKLIDSIMAQGNWNILFQEGPFAEFQRQIAIANHFALRGEIRQANFYFEKAGNALDIAYGSFRGRFGWPRNPAEIRSANLPWGENRETFDDFLLCRLQLQIESMLAEHESGILKFQNFDITVAGIEKQLGAPIQQKDADLGQMIGFIREAIALRASRESRSTVTADRFAALSDKIEPSVKNYWNRRLNIFRIFENLHYGNLGRGYFLASYLYLKQKDQFDPGGLARIFIHTAAFDEAQAILKAALATRENKAPENYPDYLYYSQMAQNLLIWLKRYGEAEKISADTAGWFKELVRENKVPRDELVDVKKALNSEVLRGKAYALLNAGRCPELDSFSGETDMEIEWQVRERIFYETCKFPRSKAFWSGVLQNPASSPEIKAIVAYYLADERDFAAAVRKISTEQNPSPLTQYLAARTALKKSLANNQKGKIPDLLISYLETANRVRTDFVLFDWGLSIKDDLTDRALASIAALNEKTAKSVFSALHRRFAWHAVTGDSLRLFSAPDAAILRRRVAATILDTPITGLADEPPAASGNGKNLIYADATLIAVYELQGKKGKFRVAQKPAAALPAGNDAVLYGAALSELIAAGNYTGNAELSPLYTFCDDCKRHPEKTPERLIILAAKDSAWQSVKNELADNFSLSPDLSQYRECPAGVPEYEDSLILSGDGVLGLPSPCNLKPEIIVLEYAKMLTPDSLQVALSLGWRRGLALVLIPQNLPQHIKTSLLFDFFQRTNRRQAKPGEAFREAKLRAEKSFPAEADLKGVYFYESIK